MAEVIAGLYELEREIGSGGGGVVYLGEHTRLHKRIILKADKRSLRTSEDKLRREVDLLKNLRHTYIPQVYDFVQEDGVVYTVMDYIEGESMDKLLSRGQRSSQPQLVKWACQLLEALVYLHSQPPYGILHGDIKPANIMLKPNGDVCLIDFNIALALGEDGAVKVGFSRGYASPEHYGMDYVSRDRAAAGSLFRTTHRKIDANSDKTGVVERSKTGCDKTEVTENSETALDKTEVMKEQTGTTALDKTEVIKEQMDTSSRSGSAGLSRNTSNDKKEILLDVRSDIYSLGATLYHLISGQRPPQDARDITPLGPDICSEAVSAILQKAMAPQPYDRYQTAEEMLTAFLRLHSTDIRMRRHKRRMIISAAVLTGGFLFGGVCTFVGLKQLENRQGALTMAEYSANALAEGNVSLAVSQALQAIPKENNILQASVTAQAQKALTDALGVYDLADGFKTLDSLELPGAPFDIVMSPAGTRVAIVYAYKVAVYDTESRQRITELSVQESALSECVFVDEEHIVYAGKEGITCHDLESGMAVWTGETATTLTLSADKKIIAAVNRDEDRALIYSVSDGKKLAERTFGGLHLTVAANDIFANPKNDIFALDETGKMLAVSFSNGGLMLLNLEDAKEDLIIYDESEYRHFEGGFYGKYFAFAAEKSGEAQFGMIDVNEAAYIGGYKTKDGLILQADEDGIYLASGSLLVCIQPDTGNEIEMAYTEEADITGFSVGESHVLVSTDDNAFSFYDSGANCMSKEICQEQCEFVRLARDYAVVGNRNNPSVRMLKLENHKEEQLLSYDARYVHDEARISHDGNTVMLFRYKGFRIYNKEGMLLTEESLPDASQIYDQQFRRKENSSWLEVTWYDGTVRCYSAADGTLISEERKEAPRKDLYEEFFTDRYRIVSTLHAAPEVYDVKSEKLIGTLEEEDYLTYVTQTGEYIITEYVKSTGERYGLLLNQELQKLAYLPGLCDVADGKLVFDYESGNLRQCRLYSLRELIAIGESYISK